MGSSAGHGTNGHAADQINKLKSKALALVVFAVYNSCLSTVQTRTKQLSNTYKNSNLLGLTKCCSHSSKDQDIIFSSCLSAALGSLLCEASSTINLTFQQFSPMLNQQLSTCRLKPVIYIFLSSYYVLVLPRTKK